MNIYHCQKIRSQITRTNFLRKSRNKLILHLLLSLNCSGNDKMSTLNSGYSLWISGMIWSDFVFLFKLFQCMTGVLIRMIFMQDLPASQLSSTSCFPFLSKVKLHPANTWKYAVWLLITCTDLLSYVFQHKQVFCFPIVSASLLVIMVAFML